MTARAGGRAPRRRKGMSRGSRRTSSTRQSRWAAGACIALAAALLAGSPADASAASPCRRPDPLRLDGRLGLDDGLDPLADPAERRSAAYDGTILRPADATAFPGARAGGPAPARPRRQPVRAVLDRAGPRRARLHRPSSGPRRRGRTRSRRSSTPSTRCARRSPSSAAPPTPTPRSADGSRIGLGRPFARLDRGQLRPGRTPTPACGPRSRSTPCAAGLNGDPGGAVFECAGDPGLRSRRGCRRSASPRTSPATRSPTTRRPI